jgi:fluoride exporter
VSYQRFFYSEGQGFIALAFAVYEVMTKLLCVMLGGAIGCACRYGAGLLFNSWFKQSKFPYATFFINLSGSFVIGMIGELYRLQVLTSVEWRLALITGLLGGYTTFSAYSLENLSLLRAGEWMIVATYASASVLLGLLCAWVGMRLAQLL